MDLDISITNWGATEQNKSRNIFVWESIDQVHWPQYSLVESMPPNAGYAT